MDEIPRTYLKNASHAQQRRYRPPQNAHILSCMLENTTFSSAGALMHTLICLDSTCNPASAGLLNAIYYF
jgi:hypothetical protein